MVDDQSAVNCVPNADDSGLYYCDYVFVSFQRRWKTNSFDLAFSLDNAGDEYWLAGFLIQYADDFEGTLLDYYVSLDYESGLNISKYTPVSEEFASRFPEAQSEADNVDSTADSEDEVIDYDAPTDTASDNDV